MEVKEWLSSLQLASARSGLIWRTCIRYDENIVEDNLPSIHFEMKKEF
jgi:hypothetical protein